MAGRRGQARGSRRARPRVPGREARGEVTRDGAAWSKGHDEQGRDEQGRDQEGDGQERRDQKGRGVAPGGVGEEGRGGGRGRGGVAQVAEGQGHVAEAFLRDVRARAPVQLPIFRSRLQGELLARLLLGPVCELAMLDL